MAIKLDNVDENEDDVSCPLCFAPPVLPSPISADVSQERSELSVYWAPSPECSPLLAPIRANSQNTFDMDRDWVVQIHNMELGLDDFDLNGLPDGMGRYSPPTSIASPPLSTYALLDSLLAPMKDNEIVDFFNHYSAGEAPIPGSNLGEEISPVQGRRQWKTCPDVGKSSSLQASHPQRCPKQTHGRVGGDPLRYDHCANLRVHHFDYSGNDPTLRPHYRRERGRWIYSDDEESVKADNEIAQKWSKAMDDFTLHRVDGL
ncbi:hypothetical protein F5Y17DRAFT_463111 [Xylariaceae sp. FL0594]|nr:hypothetical protein F5Y17DRAFT_463111 [Xylariaceae sp. FL0594]